jgi:putative ABC transport system ATP-binding protein
MIRLENVVRTYQLGKTQVEALRGVDLEISPGEFVAIMGPSGSGKSTLMHLLGALDQPDGGSVLLDGQDIAHQGRNGLAELRGRKVGFVFQMFNLIPTLSALDNVEYPMVFQGVLRRERRTRAKRLLGLVGLEGRMRHKPSELSGGERQRVAVARALANDPEILLADEPTGNLDSKSGKQIMELLARLNVEHQMTLIVVTHDPVIAGYAHRTIHILDGQIQDSADEREE